MWAFVCWEHSLRGSNYHERKPKVAAQREREGAGCPSLRAIPTQCHIIYEWSHLSAQLHERRQVNPSGEEPAHIPEPQNHEQRKRCCFKPLSVREVCYTVTDTQSSSLGQINSTPQPWQVQDNRIGPLSTCAKSVLHLITYHQLLFQAYVTLNGWALKLLQKMVLRKCNPLIPSCKKAKKMQCVD